MIRMRNQKNKFFSGQVILEFTFCMIVILLMIYALIMVFRWTGIDLVLRRKAHDASLTTEVNSFYAGGCLATDLDGNCTERGGPIADGPLKQIDPEFFRKPTKMKTIWQGAGGENIGN